MARELLTLREALCLSESYPVPEAAIRFTFFSFASFGFRRKTREDDQHQSNTAEKTWVDQPGLINELTARSDAGDFDATFRLGMIYECGWYGVPACQREAAHFYLKAAIAEHAEAQHRLGLFALQGLVSPRDYVLAYMWFALAERNGFGGIAPERDDLFRNMTARDIAVALELVDNWPKIKASNGRLIHYYRGLA